MQTGLIYDKGVFLRALFAMSAEEKRLSAMITDAFVDLALQVSAFTIALENARLKILLEPIWIRQRQIRKNLLPLDVIPRRPYVIIPRYDPLYGITDYVDVNRFRQMESDDEDRRK